MLPPADPHNFNQLKSNLRRRMREAGVDDEILETMRSAFEAALRAEPIVLSRPERKRLAQAVLKELLDELISKL